MKSFSLAAVMAVLGTAGFADPVEGVWKTRADDDGNFGHVEITPCGPAFCGVLVKAFDSTGNERASDNIGRQIVWDMVAYPDGLYDDGKIYAPDRDKEYNGDMTLSGDRLAVRGCVLGICRDGGVWTRVE